MLTQAARHKVSLGGWFEGMCPPAITRIFAFGGCAMNTLSNRQSMNRNTSIDGSWLIYWAPVDLYIHFTKLDHEWIQLKFFVTDDGRPS